MEVQHHTYSMLEWFQFIVNSEIKIKKKKVQLKNTNTTKNMILLKTKPLKEESIWNGWGKKIPTLL